MRRYVTGLLLVLLPLGTAFADEVKLGVILGYTGPIESLTGPMADGAELAMKEVSDSGALLGGKQVVAGTRRFHLHRLCCRGGGGRTAGDRRSGQRHSRRRLLGRDHRHAAAGGQAQRHRDGLSVGHVTGSVDDRRRRAVLPDGAVRRPPGRGGRRHPAGDGHSRSGHDLHQQRLRQGPGGQHRGQLHQAAAGTSPSPRRTRMARAITAPRSRPWRLSAARS